MKKWKALTAGLLALCLMPASSFMSAYAEEGEEMPESYDYTIESNEITGWPEGPQIESAAATVMDIDTGVFLYSKNATATMYPASTTKVMTTLLLLENCDLDEEITFSDIVYNLEEGSSHLGIQPGETITLRDAAYGIMLASANDISNGVAEYIGGSLSGFADLMNQKASELGCVNTHFANPHGLYSDEHYTCAHDMALIAQAAYSNPAFREIVTTRQYTIPETNMTSEERSFLNHHKMMHSDSEYYRDWCTGGKTGFTEKCLNTLVTFAEKDGKQLVSVVFRVNGAGKSYKESTQILEYAFDSFYTKVEEKAASKQSFYDIMGLRYFGDAYDLQSNVWKQSPAGHVRIKTSLPKTVSSAEMYYSASENGGGGKVLSYEFNGWPTGTSKGEFRTLYAPAQLVFEKKTEVQPAVKESKIQIEGLNDVLEQVTDIFERFYSLIAEYTAQNPLTILIAGIVILVFLILFIILIICRCNSESRTKRRRKQEEKILRQREEEIERMTTAEIEAELRMVMEQERIRKEQERAAQAEAERDAEEARIIKNMVDGGGRNSDY